MNITITQTNPSMSLTVALPGSLPSGAGARTYFYTQASASNVWVIAHNLGSHPSVVVTDSAGTMIEGDVHYDNLNQVTLSFGAGFAGTAYLV